MLANRPDIVREDYMNELCVLQDDVPPFPDEQARAFAADRSPDFVWGWVGEVGFARLRMVAADGRHEGPKGQPFAPAGCR